jgi:DNA-binding NtrC family response regulator
MEQKIYPEFPILFVDDNKDFLDITKTNLRDNQITNVELCSDNSEVLPKLESQNYSMIFLDLIMPGIRGENLLPQIVKQYPEIPVIILTAVGELETARNCLYSGAYDYLEKPVKPYKLKNLIENVLKYVDAQNENQRLRRSLLSDTLKNPRYFENIITNNEKMMNIFKYIESIAESNAPVLITGETGVGKELIARVIHKCSKRKGNLVAQNIAGIDDTMFSNTLFGHEKGSYTDAFQKQSGIIEKAANGSLFLDEIGDLSKASQVKLLRLLQEGEYLPLGAGEPKRTNTRIITATNRDIGALMGKGDFRPDLYHRLKTHEIEIPSLKKRKEDIPLLAKHFIIESARKLRKDIPGFPGRELYDLLSQYDFPGNVRELESMIYDAVSRSEEGNLSLESIREKIGKSVAGSETGVITDAKIEPAVIQEDSIVFGSNFPTYRQMKKMYLEEVLKRAGGNQSLAAKMAGLIRTTFLNKLKRVDEPESYTDGQE